MKSQHTPEHTLVEPANARAIKSSASVVNSTHGAVNSIARVLKSITAVGVGSRAVVNFTHRRVNFIQSRIEFTQQRVDFTHSVVKFITALIKFTTAVLPGPTAAVKSTRSAVIFATSAIIFNTAGVSAIAQKSQNVAETVKVIMNNIRAGKSEAINTDLLYKPENAANAIKELKPYTADTLPAIRFRAYNLTGLVGSKSTNEALRKEAVGILLQGCKDNDSGVSGQCSQALQQFLPKDFDASARLQLGSLLVVGTSYLNQVAKIAGYVGEPSHEQMLLNPRAEVGFGIKDN